MSGKAWRTSIEARISARSRQAPGEFPSRSKRAHHCLNRSSWLGPWMSRFSSGPHLAREPLEELPLLLRGPAVRPIGRPHGLRRRRVEDERAGALRVRRGEQQHHRRRACPAEDGCGLRAGRIHDRTDVVHLQLDDRRLGTAVGEPDPAHVEQDQPRERRQPVEVPRPCRPLPHDLEVGPDPRAVHEVDRSVADHLVRDVHAVMDGVVDCLLHRRSVPAGAVREIAPEHRGRVGLSSSGRRSRGPGGRCPRVPTTVPRDPRQPLAEAPHQIIR